MYIFREYFALHGPVITKICNASLISRVFPDQRKIYKLVCIFKSGNRKLLANYRSVSILPAFSEILEELYKKKKTN